MATETDTKEYFSNETDETETKCIKKTITIPGKKGMQIKIEGFALKLANERRGVKTKAKVSMEYNGKETDIAAWITTSSVYTQLKYNKYSYTADEGEDVILRWYLTTENAKYKAMMKDPAYIYSSLNVDTPPASGKNSLVVIECTSEDDAKTLAEKIKKEYSDTIVYIQS